MGLSGLESSCRCFCSIQARYRSAKYAQFRMLQNVTKLQSHDTKFNQISVPRHIWPLIIKLDPLPSAPRFVRLHNPMTVHLCSFWREWANFESIGAVNGWWAARVHRAHESIGPMGNVKNVFYFICAKYTGFWTRTGSVSPTKGNLNKHKQTCFDKDMIGLCFGYGYACRLSIHSLLQQLAASVEPQFNEYLVSDWMKCFDELSKT